ncbi:hypothetical protein KGO95_00490 [Patescibacteria group bacterium]|nr:hypothetical protein [Patescibacteria group bacterium]
MKDQGRRIVYTILAVIAGIYGVFWIIVHIASFGKFLMDTPFWTVAALFWTGLILWCGTGIISETIWMRFWNNVRMKYPGLPLVPSKERAGIALLMHAFMGPFSALITYYAIRQIQAIIKRAEDDGDDGGDIVIHIPDPDPKPSAPKEPALH